MNTYPSRICSLAVISCLALSLLTAKAAGPAIVVTNVPNFGTNNYGTTTFLSGYVTNANFTTNCLLVFDYWPNQDPSSPYIDDSKLTPYGWFSRPNFANLKTTINADGTWSCNMPSNYDQYAEEYCVVLVSTNYNPAVVSAAAGLFYNTTALSNAMEAIVYVYRPDSYRRQINWAGYGWWVKTAGVDYNNGWQGPTGPGPNYYNDSPTNAWVDAQGNLHLQITYNPLSEQGGSGWCCVELFSDESFGYGTYHCTVQTTNLANFDTNVVFSMFSWSDNFDYTNREIDMEVSYWTDVNGKTTNEDYAISPYNSSKNDEQVLRLALPGTVTNSTHVFTWNGTTNVQFETLNGNYTNSPPPANILESWTSTGQPIPLEGGETISLILWLNKGYAPGYGQPVQVTLSSFQFDPWPFQSPAQAVQISQPQKLANGHVQFGIQALPQMHIQVLSSSNLLAWQTNSPIIRVTNQARVFPSYPMPPVTLQYTDANPPSAQASYYRVVNVP